METNYLQSREHWRGINGLARLKETKLQGKQSKTVKGMSKRAKYTKLEKEAWIAQLVEHWLGTMEFVGSNTSR